jgi:N-acetylglutamate synthase-like GNAT family acetyltransferase
MLEDQPVTWARDRFHITTDRRLIPLADVLALLHETYWAKNMTADALERATRNSVCFAVLEGNTLVGFARAITDLTTYAYLSDVVIADQHRGHGLGEWLVRCILEHPELSGLRRFALLTRDAAEFYVRLGFKHGAGERNYLELLPGRMPVVPQGV